MTPSEKIIQLLGYAKELQSALERAQMMVEKATENAELFNSHAEQLGHLQVNLRPEFLVKDWTKRQLEVHKLALDYGQSKMTKNRLARDYQKRKRQQRGTM